MALGNFYLTDAGNALLAKAQTGAELKITRAQIGEGTRPAETTYANSTALVKPVKYLSIVSKTESSGQAKITVQFTNSGVGRAFNWTEFGLWAADPDYPDDRSHDILYGTAYAGDAPVPIESGLTEFVFNVIIKTGAATSLNVLVDSSLVYMTLEELDAMRGGPNGIAELGEDGKVPAGQLPEMDYDPAGSAAGVQANLTSHINNKSNPHGVSPSQIGAVPTTRKVNNKALSADVSLSAADVGAIPSAQKGTAGGVASLGSDGKVPAGQLPEMDYDPAGSAAGVQANLTSHINNKSNPHGVSPSQIGAVPTTRKVNNKALSADVSLSAADVGALPITGGTLSGNLTGKYITGTWLQATAITDLNAVATRFAVIDGSGWLYYRSAAEMLSDLGVNDAIQAAIGNAMAASY